APGLLIFCLEVLADDAVLLDRAPREGIASARVLAADAARSEIVLEARAVYEKVDGVRRLAAGAERLELSIDPILGHGNAGRELREVEKVAARRRKTLDLFR